MDLHSLKLFVHLSHSLHFSKTSNACFISPSGLTRTVQRLEEETGAVLFTRDNRKVELTPQGIRLKEYAMKIIDIWDEFNQGLEKEQEKLTGNLDIYCSVTASYSILRPVINRFRTLHSGVHIRIETGEAESAITRLINGQSDISIASLPEKLHAQLVFKKQAEIPLVLISPKTECEIKEKLNKGSDWYSLPLILPIHGLARKRIDSYFREHSIRPKIYADIAGNEAIIAMTGLGCGIGLVPELVLKESAHYKEVAVLENGPELKPYEAGFCTRKSKLKNNIISEFWKIIS